MSSSSEPKKVTLRTYDEQEFIDDEAVTRLSMTINNLIEDECVEGGIPVHNVNGAVLSKVLDYCAKHQHKANDKTEEAELQDWDKNYINVGLHVIYDLILAANYLDIKGLLDLATQAVADVIKGKMPEHIRHIFGIKNDFTAKEESEIREQNSWAFTEV